MNVRSCVLAALLIGLAAPLAPVSAQYYPSRIFREPPPDLPPGVYEDDDDAADYSRRPYGPPPTDYGATAGNPYPEDRRAAAPGHVDPDRERGPQSSSLPIGEPPAVIYGSRPYDAPGVQSRAIDPPVGYGAPRYEDPNAPRPPAEVPGAPVHTGSIPAHTGTVPQQQTGPGQPPPASVMTLPPEDQPEVGEPKELPPHLKRQLVDYRSKEPAGTIVIDTANTHLYLVLGNGKAMRYGIGVGREGFTWSGREKVSRKTEWPDWHPPEQMIERQPYLPRFMAGGPGNPMGARALYLGKTLYRIHGTNQPSTIGKFVSSGCIRLLNDDVEDLYERVKLGAQVVVLPGNPPATAAAPPPAREAEVRPPATAAR